MAETERRPSLTATPAARPAARLGRYALAAGLVAAAALVAKGLMTMLPLPDPGMVFLAAVLLSAVLAGLGPSIFAAVLGLLIYDFFFVDPRLTFTVTKPQDVLSLFMFLAVAVLTSELTARVLKSIRFAADLDHRGQARVEHAAKIDIAGAAAGGDNHRFVRAQLHRRQRAFHIALGTKAL